MVFCCIVFFFWFWLFGLMKIEMVVSLLENMICEILCLVGWFCVGVVFVLLLLEIMCCICWIFWKFGGGVIC